jgi:DNA glycosylase AlkZ-like
MKLSEVALRRMSSQLLVSSNCKTAADIVWRLGAIQAQDYSGGEWSIGLRLPESTLVGIDRAIAERKVIRTWGLRGTLHFFSSADIRWILELLSPMIISRLGRRYRELELDAATLKKTNSILEKSLRGNKHLTRSELVAIIEKNGISCKGQRAVFILHRASLDRIICFGVTRGKQQTHTLFDEWVPRAKSLSREESLAELAHRYFTSHGPATIQDYMWWSGLRASDANAGLEMIKSKLERVNIEDDVYWMIADATFPRATRPVAFLLPSFDELLIGYKERSALIPSAYSTRLRTGGMPNQVIVIDGQVAGIWTRFLKKDTVVVQTELFRQLKKPEREALDTAIERYARFVGKDPILESA